MKRLNYDNEDKNTYPVSSFQVIDQKGFAVSVFIELDDEATAAKEAFRKLIHKKMGKEEFDTKYKLAFNQRIITVPKYLAKVKELQQDKAQNELADGLYIVNRNEVENYYNELTGFDRSKESNSAGQTSFFSNFPPLMPTQTLTPITTITFPEIALRTRDAHKLRGYFGELFRAHSPLLHNHLETEDQPTNQTSGDAAGAVAVKYRYAYPLVQYKVLDRVPTLVGLGEGAVLLTHLFLQMRELDIDGANFPVLSKHIRHEQVPIGMTDDLLEYRFETLWMALNQANYRDYRHYSEAEQQAQLKRVLTSQLLATFREFGLWLPTHERIMLRLSVQARTTQFKNQTMVAFTGGFLANVVLPDGMGLGKAVSRGFGSLKRLND